MNREPDYLARTENPQNKPQGAGTHTDVEIIYFDRMPFIPGVGRNGCVASYFEPRIGQTFDFLKTFSSADTAQNQSIYASDQIKKPVLQVLAQKGVTPSQWARSGKPTEDSEAVVCPFGEYCNTNRNAAVDYMVIMHNQAREVRPGEDPKEISQEIDYEIKHAEQLAASSFDSHRGCKMGEVRYEVLTGKVVQKGLASVFGNRGYPGQIKVIK